MTKFETLYASIKGLQELGLPLNEETLKAADELEEQLIKTKILPAMSKDIEPMLSQIQRDLVLVVEYHPGEPISVALSRKTKISEIVDAKQLTPKANKSVSNEQKNATEELSSPMRTRGAYTDLCITCPDGTVINEQRAKDTFVKAILMVGLDKAMTVFPRTFFADQKNINRAFDFVELAPNIFLRLNNNNKRKARYLKCLSDKYNLGWKVEVIK